MGGGEAADFGDADHGQAWVVARRIIVHTGEQLASVTPGLRLAGGLPVRSLLGGAGRAAAMARTASAHGQQDVPVEGLLQPDLVTVEADLPFGWLVAVFGVGAHVACRACSSESDQSRQRT